MQTQRTARAALLLAGMSLLASCQAEKHEHNVSRSEAAELIQRATGLDVLETTVTAQRTDVTVRYAPGLLDPDSAFASLAIAAGKIWKLPGVAGKSDTVAISVAREVKSGLTEKNTYFYYRNVDGARSR
jgi:hypothetical protein